MDRYWKLVDTNLKAGRVRLVFVADSIPPELRRVVEFLNSQMNPAEVLAIEIKQFVGSGVRTLCRRSSVRPLTPRRFGTVGSHAVASGTVNRSSTHYARGKAPRSRPLPNSY